MAPPSVSPSVSLAPSTPKKKHGADFDMWFLDFSNTYNLNLGLPPPGISPAKRKTLAKENPELFLYFRLQYHYFQGNSRRIQKLFDQSAKDVHRQWVRKPFSEFDTTPSITALPRAASEPERCELINRLSGILEEWRPVKSASSISSRYPFSPLNIPPPSSPTLDRQLQRFKRRSGERQTSPSPLSPKKPKSAISSISRDYREETEDEDEGDTDLQSVHTIQRTIFTRPDPPSQNSRRSRQSFYQLSQSANTSRSTFVSKVFEQEEDGPPPVSQQTQITAEASTQEKPRLSQPSFESFSDAAPSSSVDIAPRSYFSRPQETSAVPQEHELHGNVRRALATNNSDSYSDFSMPLEILDALDSSPPAPVTRLEPRVMHSEPRDTNPEPRTTLPEPPVISPIHSPVKTPRSGKMSLEDRLQEVWRMYCYLSQLRYYAYDFQLGLILHLTGHPY